ncbi:hypothetical protein KJ695_04575 [Patescibacteria group bacterium]|nr:hypothetical protein [Patescibacteria group bacterium]MBU4057153.1 hypothetical protein [Patescibacteria group bacterium]MBU4369101.1 hypothetical protein [Patescibacteria group bacterium]
MRRKIDISELKNYDKAFFTLNDLVKIFNVDEDILKVALNRAAKSGKIIRLRKNLYQLPDKIYDPKKVASELYQPSYLSFESALSEYGILSQIPYILTFATTNKSKKIALGTQRAEYRQIKKELFFGYELKNGIFIALPEKALCDQLYFISRGLAALNFKELNLSKIFFKKFLFFARKYPQATQILTKNLKDILEK